MLHNIYRPMFFPHLRDEQKESHKERIMHLQERYDSWEQSEGYKACTRHKISTLEDAPMSSLELCSGEEVLSKSLKVVGFDATTLDNNLKGTATSKLSLKQLEDRIRDGSIRNHPHLYKRFSVVWAAPECRTWSIASNGRYRNKDFIEGLRILLSRKMHSKLDVTSKAWSTFFPTTKCKTKILLL